MKKYIAPELEVLKMNVVDIITTSGEKEKDETGIYSLGGYDVIETADR